MELREMIPAEQKYTYRQSHQLDAQTGCIGYLRGDFGSTGKEFYSSWFDNMAYLKTPEFQAELDQVINALREDSQYGGILADRNSLSDVCRQSTTPKFGRDESGFRVNTQDYAYLLRLNPSPGDYNFCVYCYKRDYLDRNMRNAEHGIRFITPSYKEKFRIADGDSIRMTFPDGEYQDRECRFIDETHLEVGNSLYHICEFAERRSFPCASRSRRSVSVLWKAPAKSSPLPRVKTDIPPQGSTRRRAFPQKRLPPPSTMLPV